MTLMPVSKTSTLVRLVDERRRGRGGSGRCFLALTGPASSTGCTDDVEDAAERGWTDRHHDGAAGVGDVHAAHEAVGGVHGDGADGRLAEVLRDLEHQVVLLVAEARVGDGKRVQDPRQLAGRELDVDDGTDDLSDLALRQRGGGGMDVDSGRLDEEEGAAVGSFSLAFRFEPEGARRAH